MLKLLILAIAVAGASLGARAEDASTTTNTVVTPLTMIAACQTQSRGRFFQARDYEWRRAQQVAYGQCLGAGGISQECANFMRCQWIDDLRPPVPPPVPPPAPPGYARYDWGQGQNGWGYCYEWTWDHHVLNGGRAVPNDYCERYRPSHYQWGRGRDNNTYCYQWTPYGLAMNEGRPVPNNYCY